MGVVHRLVKRVVASPMLLLVIASIAPVVHLVHPKVGLWQILIVVDVIVYVMTYEELLLLLRT